MYGTAIMMAAFLRPSLSAKMPDGTAPKIAPIANIDAIHVPSSFVTRITESAAFNWLKTGDVHARPVPAAAAPKQTNAKKKRQFWWIVCEMIWLKPTWFIFVFISS